MYQNSSKFTNPSFAQYFAFLRIKSGFNTISSFAKILETKGYSYDCSLFSHWQNGSRAPTNRLLVIDLIKIFIDSKIIKFENQVNLFFTCLNMSTISESELKKLPSLLNNEVLTSWDNELEKFICSDLLDKKLKIKNSVYNKKKHRFNFELSSDAFLYIKKISKKNHFSKATFLRKLIEEHRDSETSI